MFMQPVRHMEFPKAHCMTMLEGNTRKEILAIQQFSQPLKKEIAYTCEILQTMAFPLSRDIVSMVVQRYLAQVKRTNPFTNGIPGEACWKGFLRRWLCLTERRPQYLPRNRAEAANLQVIKGWLAKVNIFLQQHEMLRLPDLEGRMWNCDETGFCTAHGI